MTTINRDEWLAALGDAVRPIDSSALTLSEIAEQFGCGRQAAYLRIKRLIESGRARRVYKVIQLTSGLRRVAAYVLVPVAPTPAPTAKPSRKATR